MPKLLATLILLMMVALQSLPFYAQATTLDSASTFVSTDLVTADQIGAQGQAAKSKQQGPMVKVGFSGSVTKGSKVTATAATGGFSTSDDQMYFTWYLKKNGCELGSEANDKCDLDGDGKVTENDWKIAATRIIVRGDFEPTAGLYAGNKADIVDSSGPEAIPEWKYTWGDENGKDDTDCYLQDSNSGHFFELRESGDAEINDCPSGYHMACVKDIPKADTLSCFVPGDEPARVKAQTDWKNNTDNKTIIDECSAPDTSVTPARIKTEQEITDCEVAKGMPANYVSSKMNVCQETDMNVSSDNCDTEGTELKDIVNFHVDLKCDDGSAATCVANNNAGLTVKNVDGKTLAHILGKDAILFNPSIALTTTNYDNTTKDTLCGTTDTTVTPSVFKPGILTSLLSSSINTPVFGSYYAGKNVQNDEGNFGNFGSTCRGIIDTAVNGGTDPDGIVIVANKNLQANCSFKRGDNVCKHLFPQIPSELGAKVGSGEMTLGEKEFWGADPQSSSTNGKQKDEAAIMGLGVTTFSWTYMPGDQVGVAVEGTSLLPTDHVDHSYRIVWALPTGTCPDLEDLGDEETGIDRAFYIDDSSGSKVGILTAAVDIDECLKDNLLEPDDQGFGKMQVSVATTPDNPIDDPNGRGDTVNATATVANVDASALGFDWHIEESRDGSAQPTDDTAWVDITNKFTTRDELIGIGRNQFKFDLDLPKAALDNALSSTAKNDGTYYIRVKAKVAEITGEDSQYSKGLSKPIKVYLQKNQIRIYPVSADSSGMLSLNDGTSSIKTEICSGIENAEEKNRCYVTQNEIIGIKIDNADNTNKLAGFSWKINGNEFNCKSSISTQCSQGNILFFPVLGNVGEAVDVVATAVNIATNDKVEISRHFVIIEPQVQIYSLDDSAAWAKLLGYYKDLNGNRYPDYSTQVMETLAGNTVTLGAAFYPAWKGGQAGFDWAIDGQVDKTLSGQTQITLPITKTTGDSYNIGLVANYMPGKNDEQLNNLRKALLKNWGISPEDTIETNNNANMQINVVDSPTVAAANNKPAGLTASLITHLPQQMFFLLKITLTSFALLLITGLLFAVMPEPLFEKESDIR